MTAPMTEIGQTPPVVALYGWLGLIPFLVPPVIGWAVPALAGVATTILMAYGALILSFLGGARWGLAVARPRPDPWVISLAMLPSIVGLILLAAPALPTPWRLGGLALALALHWVWDLVSRDRPAWYPRLRSILTAGAITGLLAGAAIPFG